MAAHRPTRKPKRPPIVKEPAPSVAAQAAFSPEDVLTPAFFELAPDGILVTEVLSGVFAVAMVAVAIVVAARRRRKVRAPLQIVDAKTWRMPPLAELTKPQASLMREIGLFTLRGYLFVAALLAVVKFVQLAVGGGGTS